MSATGDPRIWICPCCRFARVSQPGESLCECPCELCKDDPEWGCDEDERDEEDE